MERIRELLYSTEEDKFVGMQLSVARQMADNQRIIATTIHLNGLYFQNFGDLYALGRFPRIYPPTVWAEMKFLSLDRQALASSMIKWTENPIHDSLTKVGEFHSMVDQPQQQPAASPLMMNGMSAARPTMDPKLVESLNSTAKSMFKNIMGFMGDKQYGEALVLAQEILKTGLEKPALIDEIYCQLMKQLFDNPKMESMQRGLGLLMLCLDTFPPLESQPYVEYFIRSRISKPTMDEFLKTLHTTLHGGRRLVAPTPDEIMWVAGGRVSNRLGYAVTLDRPQWEGKAAERRPPPPMPAIPTDRLDARACMVCRKDCVIL